MFGNVLATAVGSYTSDCAKMRLNGIHWVIKLYIFFAKDDLRRKRQ